MEYNFISIEEKWQRYWREKKVYNSSNNSDLPKYYVLDMFPYPSGSGLHVGHPLGYIASDIISRYKRTKGFNVLHPMGFDSFGLPAEQYAIKTGQHPKITTENNIVRFKEQLNKLGLSYDWDREIKTSDSSYYKWTQWIFLKIYNSYFDKEKNKAVNIDDLKIPKGLENDQINKFIDSKRLAYIDTIDVNWCEELGTVLANEEVIGGLSERGGYPVIRKPMKQWVMRITDYADRLLEDLEDLDWPESIKSSQRNWIGKSEGAEISFQVDNNNKIDVFTTRPDTIFGATYLVLAPEHPILDLIVAENQKEEINKYKEIASSKSDLERQENQKNKTGVFTGSYAINPMSNKKIPIWISDYVLYGYGTGAIMAVPAHDERDYEFANKFNLEIVKVINSKDDFYSGSGEIINSGKYNGIDSLEFKAVVTEILEKKGMGKKTTNYKLRDWIFTRQRYWGEPIPILHSDNGTKSVDEKNLPLELPEVDSYLPTADGMSPLARNDEWKSVSINGKKYLRETNTMPQWAGSCWYYLRFLDPKNEFNFASEESIKYWMPVDLYIGGQEHAVLHLLYSRFWHHVLYDLGLVSTKEPFKKLYNQGMILGDDGTKMSKSRGNVINPEEIMDEYGADSMRLYEMFMGPLNKSKPWSTKGLQGCFRFVNKLWSIIVDENGNLSTKIVDSDEKDKDTLFLHHQTIKKIGEDIENLHFNTAVSQLMIYCNHLQKCNTVSKKLIEELVIILSPFVPHLSEEFWNFLGHSETITYQSWPQFDESLMQQDKVTIAVQVNGKLRANINISKDLEEKDVVSEALSLDNVEKYTSEGNIVKTIYVPNRLLNFVVQ